MARGGDRPSWPGGAAPEVLSVKLHPPGGTVLLARPRLVRLLDEELQGPLTLVIAPAGSGKTSLVAGWAAHTLRLTAWLTADETDQEPGRFLLSLMTCLEGAVPGVASEARSLLSRHHDPVEVMTALLASMGRAEAEDVVLIIDDAHLACRPELGAQLMAQLARFAPDWLHLVLIARDGLGLPLDRLRARGQLGEVRFSELRFSVEESEELLGLLAPELSARDRARAARRAGGWAVGLRVSALAARSARAQPPGGQSSSCDLLLEAQLVEAYLNHEVLGEQRPQLVTVLEAAALVERIDASLAAAMTGLERAGDLLAEAEARGLFLTRLDGLGRFELHEVVRGILASGLQSRSPEQMCAMQAGAAGWYESHDEPSLAAEHWFAAGHPKEALRALTRATASFDDSRLGFAMFDAVSRMPMSEVFEDTAAAVDHTWLQHWVDRSAFLRGIDQLVDAGSAGGTTAELQGRIMLLRAAACLQRGEWDDVPGLTDQGLDLLGPGAWKDPIGRFAWNVDCRATALAERWDERSARTRHALRSMATGPSARLHLDATRALGEALAGNPLRALTLAGQIRQAVVEAPDSAMAQELALAEAIARREVGDRELAVPILTELTGNQQSMVPYAPLLAWLELSTAHVADGLLDRARECLARARHLAEADLHGPGIRTRIGLVASRIALAGGQRQEAQAQAAAIPDLFWREITTARVLLATGDREAARATLDTATASSPRQAIVRDLLLSRVQPGPEEAERHLLRAVERASDHGLLQTVADEGPEVLDRVEVFAAVAPEGWIDRLRRTVLTQTDVGAVRHEALSQLTTRERQVLRMLPGRLTVSEIADELNITHNTVKFHLKVIYQKLGCSSRAEAAAIARSATRVARTAR